jgi:hypothetical protein
MFWTHWNLSAFRSFYGLAAYASTPHKQSLLEHGTQPRNVAL